MIGAGRIVGTLARHFTLAEGGREHQPGASMYTADLPTAALGGSLAA
jgi:hypothetical protein